jgi:hypothetical protein
LDIPQAGGFICFICTSGEDVPTIGAKYATAEATLMPRNMAICPPNACTAGCVPDGLGFSVVGDWDGVGILGWPLMGML